MLRLIVLPADSERPPIPEPDDPTAEIWRDNHGTIAGVGQIAGDECWLHLPGLGSFAFGAASTEVRAIPLQAVVSGRIVDAYHRVVVPFALQVRGCEVLHASAVRTRWGVLALCATKETGKSTLAYALHERGHPLWADDAVAFRVQGSTPEALSLPFRLRLRSPSISFFRRDTAGEGWLHHTAAEPLALAPEPLAAICVLARSPETHAGPPAEIERSKAADALAAVLTHAQCFTLRNAVEKQRMMRNYLKLISTVPVLRVRFRAGLENLPAILDAIESAVEANAPEAGWT